MADELDAGAVVILLGELGYPLTRSAAVERLAQFSESDRDHVLVAVIDRQIVGLLSLDIAPLFAEGGAFARITALVVTNAHRGLGVGLALVSEAERLARAAGCATIQVSSGRRPERRSAHRFYSRLGYADVGNHHTLYEKNLPP